jgi:ABC-type sugar transport system ATPase subunit
MAEALLTLEGVHTHIGQYHVLQGVDFSVPRGTMTVLLGRNGAGKTTTLRTIMGYLRPRAGRVELAGQPIHGRRTHEIAMLGVGFAPEESGIFADLSVAANIAIATWTRPTAQWPASGWPPTSGRGRRCGAGRSVPRRPTTTAGGTARSSDSRATWRRLVQSRWLPPLLDRQYEISVVSVEFVHSPYSAIGRLRPTPPQ